jgi:hypothetical protein
LEGESVLALTWDRILAGLDQVLDLCRSLDLEEEVAQSRFHHHRELLVGLTQQFRDGGHAAAMEHYNTDRLAHVVALAESHELVLLDLFLRANASSDILQRKLREALDGPVLPTEEDKNTNHGRNILFELNLAAKLWTVGIMPTLGEHPDLSCEIDGKKLLIACKRPLTDFGGRNTIRDAWTSLVRQSKKDRPGTRGVIALSIGKLVWRASHDHSE